MSVWKRNYKLTFFYSPNWGEWHWRYWHTNGNIISISSEGYKNLSDAEEMALVTLGGVAIKDRQTKRIKAIARNTYYIPVNYTGARWTD